VNRKADFFYKTNRFESIRVTNLIESIRIANWNALISVARCGDGERRSSYIAVVNDFRRLRYVLCWNKNAENSKFHSLEFSQV